MDFGDLKDDKVIQNKILAFHNSVDKVDKLLESIINVDTEKLTTKHKVDYDLFVAYTFNTLYWLYLRSKGIDPNTDEVKNQLKRVKDYMIKAKQAHERNTIRPKLNVPVAGRFIKHGIERADTEEQPKNKKIKFDE